jgi:ATP-dependent RNA circularization protein (DNA/RNA ligase family)
METIERLKEMVNKPFLYNNDEVVILGYADHVGEDGLEIEIYLNNGKTLEWNMGDLPEKINRFKPITKNVLIIANKKLDSVSTINPNIIQQMRDCLLDEIRKVKESKDNIPQARSVIDGVNALTSLAKIELDYRKYVDRTN